MNKKIILALIFSMIAPSAVLAQSDASTSASAETHKQVMDAFAGVNQYTDNFFTPVRTKEDVDAKKKRKEFDENSFVSGDGQMRGTLPPIKKLRLSIKYRNKTQDALKIQEGAAVTSDNQAILDCETMEYFAERTELEADGGVVINFPKNDATIKADKVIYNQSSNLIKAFGNVVLITDGKELFGDYMQVDMNEENAFIDNPTTDVFQIHARAKKGYMYGDKIIQEQGSILVTKKMMIKLRSEMFGPDLDTMYLANKDKSYYAKDSHGEKFKIKTDDLIINSRKEHDTITLKNAEIYFNNKKVGKISSITMHTNKAQDYLEGNYPEIGTLTNMGMYAGPGFVFDTPKGSTLKLIPMLNYDGKFGFGGIAKFKNATNKTDIGYGTCNETLLVRGKQRLDDNLFFQYGANSYMDDWFMGFRMPKYIGELVYQDYNLRRDFLGEDKNMTFSYRLAGAFVQDQDVGAGNISKIGGDGGVSTARFKYMAEVAQTLYSRNSDAFLTNAWLADIPKDDIFSFKFDMVLQGSAAVYGTGDTQVLARVGPQLHTQYKYWMQDVGYFLTGFSDESPLIAFDKFMYGRSNAYVRESIRLNKYLTLSWMGSFNLLRDSWDGNMIQENSWFFSIGPDDIKLNIGYDTVRQQSFVTMAMYLDAKGSSIEYNRMIIKNPEKIGKDPSGVVNPYNSFASNPPLDEEGVQRAEVIDIKEVL